jgi:hypothetical protein
MLLILFYDCSPSGRDRELAWAAGSLLSLKLKMLYKEEETVWCWRKQIKPTLIPRDPDGGVTCRREKIVVSRRGEVEGWGGSCRLAGAVHCAISSLLHCLRLVTTFPITFGGQKNSSPSTMGTRVKEEYWNSKSPSVTGGAIL